MHLRELLSETVAKVEVWSRKVKRGRRQVLELKRGVMYLWGD
jgi:hypothetical protein